MAVIDTRFYPSYNLPIPSEALKLPPEPLPFWWCEPYQRYLLELSFSPIDLSQEELEWLNQNFSPLMARTATRRILGLIATWRLESVKSHPELYKKLNELALSTFFSNSKIIYRQTQLLKFLETKNIPNLLIKGAALIKEIPEAIHYRMIGDIDFVVPEKHVPFIFEHLRNSNYRYDKSLFFGNHFSTIESVLPFRHSLDLYDINSKVGLDLHWHLCPQAPNSKFDNILGAHQIMSTAAGGPKTLDPSAMILLSTIHALGDRWNQPLSHWAIDVLMLIKKHQTNLDWKRLLWLAKKTQYVSFIKLALDFLNQISPDCIPQTIKKRAKVLRPGFIDRFDTFFLTLMRRDVDLRGLSRFIMNIYRTEFFKRSWPSPAILRRYIYYYSKTEKTVEIKERFKRYKDTVLTKEIKKFVLNLYKSPLKSS